MAYSVADIKNIIDDEEAEQLLENEREGIYTPHRVSSSYKIIPPISGNPATDRAIHRMNCHGSLYYFATACLQQNKLQRNPDLAKNLHYQMCKVVEKDGLQDVIEIPRDHFKSTIFSMSLPMWRALPFTDTDEQLFRQLGYGDEYILWMRRAHRQDYRWLLASEVITNAIKLGKKIGNHYVNNRIFRDLFPEILPDASSTWNDQSLHHKRTPLGSGHGEGTYDFIGVDGALQSRHYDGIIQDDLFGKEALKSEPKRISTVEWHQLLVGAMDADHTSGGRENDELVVGNRWAYNDLNSYIRTNEQYFNFTTHSALGGCCKLHPYGTPIFPEAFSLQKLEKWKKRLGSYLFSCQFLNVPINPAETKFSKKDLRYYEWVPDTSNTVVGSSRDGSKQKGRVAIRHHVHEGDVMPDVLPRTLNRYMIVDPNHSGNEGRCRHAITVTGVAHDPRRIYLLDVWAKACGVDEFIGTMFNMAYTFKLTEIWLETIAAQKYLKYHLDYMIKAGLYDLFPGRKYPDADQRIEWAKRIKIRELKTPKTKNAKQMRIDGLGPIIERNELWVNTKGQTEFMEEIESYPNGQLRDVLDTLGYGPQVWGFEADDDDVESSVLYRQRKWERDSRVH